MAQKDPFLVASRTDTSSFILFPHLNLISSLSRGNCVIRLFFFLPFTWGQRGRDKSYFHIEALLEAILGGRRCHISLLGIESNRKGKGNMAN